MATTRGNRRGSRFHINGGVATCHDQYENHVRYSIHDVSATGLCLTHGRSMPVGEQLRLDLWWPDVGSGMACGRVVRPVGDDGFGLEFTEVDEDFSLALEELSIIDFLQAQAPVTIVYVRDPHLAEALVATDRGNARVKWVKTTLDAICELQQPWSPVQSVVLDTTPSGLEFAAFLKAELPKVRRVLTYSCESEAAAQALASGLADEVVLPLA